MSTTFFTHSTNRRSAADPRKTARQSPGALSSASLCSWPRTSSSRRTRRPRRFAIPRACSRTEPKVRAGRQLIHNLRLSFRFPVPHVPSTPLFFLSLPSPPLPFRRLACAIKSTRSPCIRSPLSHHTSRCGRPTVGRAAAHDGVPVFGQRSSRGGVE